MAISKSKMEISPNWQDSARCFIGMKNKTAKQKKRRARRRTNHVLGRASSRGVIVTVSYGYDIHRIKVTEKAYAAIKSGKEIKIQGQGFMHEEDGLCKDHWVFNRVPGEILRLAGQWGRI
jgi:hypothetical protein